MKKLFILFLLISANANAAPTNNLKWEEWSDKIFEQAKKERKLVVLDVEAIWCHWCHVMDQTTYQDKEVTAILQKNYITVKVNQDANPEISHRYENYGWPATIFFNSDGKELLKERGYIEPEKMAYILADLVKNPVAQVAQEKEYKPATGKGLAAAEQKVLLDTFRDAYDQTNAGWGSSHKFLDENTIEYAIGKSDKGNFYDQASQKTLRASFNLIDPVWGGVYQYSDQPNWKSPHFEKIISFQSAYIKSYAFGYGKFGDKKYLNAAYDVTKYIDKFFTGPEGGFYTSQNADLSEKVDGHKYYVLSAAKREKMGLPYIDKNVYANENGYMISALVTLHNMSGDQVALDRAIKAATWIIKNRSLPGGGFKHGDADKSGPYLGDSLAMANATLDLYGATGDRNWLKLSTQTAKFIAARFADIKNGGFYTSAKTARTAPVKQTAENILAARYFNMLSYYSGNKDYKQPATAAMRYIASPDLVRDSGLEPGILLADEEINNTPLHLTVVGKKSDAKTASLFKAALAVPVLYKQIEWYDKAEGKLPSSVDIEYPELPQPAVFLCLKNTCSPPMYEPQDIAKFLKTVQK